MNDRELTILALAVTVGIFLWERQERQNAGVMTTAQATTDKTIAGLANYLDW